MNDFSKRLALVLRHLRKTAGYSQEELAEKLGVSRTSYLYYEAGKIQPDLLAVRGMAELYQVPAEVFLYPENYPVEEKAGPLE